uniref:Uncharacterized protein n=1 Tax=Anguilla anguilla TaxID=7936 RepID=A0A0E9SL31_ANGAN
MSKRIQMNISQLLKGSTEYLLCTG